MAYKKISGFGVQSSLVPLLKFIFLGSVLTGCNTLEHAIKEQKNPLEGVRSTIQYPTESPAQQEISHIPNRLVSDKVDSFLQHGSQAGHTSSNPSLAYPLTWKWIAYVGPAAEKESYPAVTPPLKVGERVFVLGAQDFLYALDTKTGAVQGKVSLQTPQAPQKDTLQDEALQDAPPKIVSDGLAGGLAYHQETGSLIATMPSGEVIAIDATTLGIKWRTLLQSPARGGATLWKNQAYIVTADQQVWCIAIETGKILWHYKRTGHSAVYFSPLKPAVSEQAVLCTFAGGIVVALNPFTGGLLWLQNLVHPDIRQHLYESFSQLFMPIILENGNIVVAYNNILSVRTFKDGEEKWKKKISLACQPIAHKALLWVATQDHQLACVYAQSGEVAWKVLLPVDADPAALWLARGHLFILGKKGYYGIFDARTGKPGYAVNLQVPFLNISGADNTIILWDKEYRVWYLESQFKGDLPL